MFSRINFVKHLVPASRRTFISIRVNHDYSSRVCSSFRPSQQQDQRRFASRINGAKDHLDELLGYSNPSSPEKLHLDELAPGAENREQRAQITPQQQLTKLERAFERFEVNCHHQEKVGETKFRRTNEIFEKSVRIIEENGGLDSAIKTELSQFGTALLRCCGNLMYEVAPDIRQSLADNLVEFIHSHGLPLDITHYNALIRVMNENGKQFDPKEILTQLEQAKIAPDRLTYQRLVHQYCMQGDVERATQLLEKMKSLGMDLNEGVFASLILGYSKQDGSPAILDIIDLMKNSGITIGSKVITTAITTRLKTPGKDSSSEKDLEVILDLLRNSNIQFDPVEATELLICLSSIEKPSDVVVNIIDYVRSNKILRGPPDRIRLLYELIKSNSLQLASEIFWSVKISRPENIRPNFGASYIDMICSHSFIPQEHILSECNRLKETGYNTSIFLTLVSIAASRKRPELVRAALDILKQEGQPKCHLYWPLLAQSKGTDDIIKVLKEDLRDMAWADISDTFSMWVWPRFSHDYRKLFEINNSELSYDNGILIESLIKYGIDKKCFNDVANFLIQSDPEIILNSKIDETQATQDGNLSDEKGREETDSFDEEEQSDTDQISRPKRKTAIKNNDLYSFLLTGISKVSDNPNDVRKVFDLVYKVRSIQPSRSSLRAMVQSHLNQGNYEEAARIMVEFSEKYHYTPCKNSILMSCVEHQDEKTLNAVIMASEKVHGVSNSLIDLAFVYFRQGKVDQAQKLFCSITPQQSFVRRVCSNLKKMSDFEALRCYKMLARDCATIYRNEIIRHLIILHDKNGNSDALLELWNCMQEDEVQPSRACMKLMVRVLEKYGHSVNSLSSEQSQEA